MKQQRRRQRWRRRWWQNGRARVKRHRSTQRQSTRAHKRIFWSFGERRFVACVNVGCQKSHKRWLADAFRTTCARARTNRRSAAQRKKIALAERALNDRITFSSAAAVASKARDGLAARLVSTLVRVAALRRRRRRRRRRRKASNGRRPPNAARRRPF